MSLTSSLTKAEKVPAGIMMMLKSLGVDPNGIMEQATRAVDIVVQKLDSIEKNQQKILAEIAELKSAKRATL